MASRKQDLDALTDDQLLDMRMCDLKLTIRDTPLEGRINQLNEELAARGIRFAPHFWLSDDWYSPDGIPGIAIPFYLAHPRLMRLERKQLLEVEGGTHQWCMKILRHEAGHAIDTAYRLRRKASYRKVFGKPSEPYPEYYHPKTSSRDFVLHLEMWYAQAHPLEDFAETFAVWMNPHSDWNVRYAGYPVMRKLAYVDRLMKQCRDAKSEVPMTTRFFNIKRMRKKLRTHYTEKRRLY
ncbi:MAG: putative zinc-binding metallopeptidase, partial [Planctomycetes bacterium]|nr:putative zinc-binding metallopeptidase [Planctomycetota bacterium]